LRAHHALPYARVARVDNVPHGTFEIDAYGQRSREEVLDLFLITIATGVDAVTGLLAVFGSGTALDLRRR
jgi:hypothetical protein